MEQTTLRVSGMHCGACESGINKALSRLDGVRRSAADHQKGEVRVVFDPGRTSLDAIRASLERAGYAVEGVVSRTGAPGGSV